MAYEKAPQPVSDYAGDKTHNRRWQVYVSESKKKIKIN